MSRGLVFAEPGSTVCTLAEVKSWVRENVQELDGTLGAFGRAMIGSGQRRGARLHPDSLAVDIVLYDSQHIRHIITN